MDRKVEILDRREVFQQAVFRVEQARLRHTRYDGSMSDEMTRLNLDRGDSVAALVHVLDDDCLVFTEQFRFPTYDRGPGWLLELPAGILGPDEEPVEAVRREVLEELGFQLPRGPRHVGTFYLSPGGSSERLHLFYAAVSRDDQVAEGGGVEHEGEDIRVVRMATDQALQAAREGRIGDAKTLVALFWLDRQRHDDRTT